MNELMISSVNDNHSHMTEESLGSMKKFKNEPFNEHPIDADTLHFIEEQTKGTNDADFENYYNTPQTAEDNPQNQENELDEEVNYDDFVGLKFNYGHSEPINPSCDDCCICERTLPLTWHHLIPRTTHSKMMRMHQYTQEHLNSRGIWVCRACHSAVHGMYDNYELGETYNTLEDLLKTEKVEKWIKYIQNRKLTAHSNDGRTRKANRIVQLEKMEKNNKNTQNNVTQPKYV